LPTLAVQSRTVGRGWVIRGLIIAATIVVAVSVLGIGVLVVSGRRTQARELAGFLPNLLVLFRGLLRDPRPGSSA
jgi:nitroreductase